MINNQLFKLSDIPEYHPVLQQYEYIEFWRTQARRCVEGYWVSGKWMPGPLYHYINFHNIKIETPKTKGFKIGLPFLRDIDWELFFVYEEARGFSGFADDPEYTCNRKLSNSADEGIPYLKELNLFDNYVETGVIRKEDLNKKYIPAREYLRITHKENNGKALYQNEAKNIVSLQARGGGKSYAAAGIILHNWRYGGAVDYDEYYEASQANTPFTSDTILGAITSQWSMPLMEKVLFGDFHTPGAYKKDGLFEPPPLKKSYSGSKMPPSTLKNVDGSLLNHVTFHDNPLAGNSGRANLMVLDEVGFFDCIVETLGAVQEATTSMESKNQVVFMLGTGGIASGGAVLYAEKVFRNPEEYDCLAFNDEWEDTGKIGYFVPVTMTRIKHKKGPNLITDLKSAEREEELTRAKLKSGDRVKYETHLVNSPIKPSEALLVVEGSRFPVVLLKDQLNRVYSDPNCRAILQGSSKGWLKYREGELYLDPVQDSSPIRDYPVKDKDDKTGLTEIFFHPVRNEGVVPQGRYILGADTVDKDVSTTDSLPSVFVFDRMDRIIVAEYTGRTDDAKFFYEQCRRLCHYYNGKLLYEKNLTGLYTYFDQKKETYLLAETPYQVRGADYKPSTNTSKGIHINNSNKKTGIDYIASWLKKTVSSKDDTLMLEKIYSPALLQELIRWNPDGNFDRVSSLITVMWYDETLHQVKEDERNEDKKHTSFIESKYALKRGLLKKKHDPYNFDAFEEIDNPN